MKDYPGLAKPQKIKLDILDRDLHVHLLEDTDGINQLGESLQLQWKDQEHEIEGMFMIDDGGDSHVLFNRERLSNRIIVHEAYHAAVHLLDDVGQEFDINNHEIYALLVEYLFSRIEAMFYGPSPKFPVS
jgi:hypothetical protein